MYAAHFAAGLAIKARAPRAPTWALLTGAFLPDILWIGFARVGIEPTAIANFFDDWSHSLAMVISWGALFALAFWRQGRGVVLAVWVAACSHFLLDLPIHPKFLALYPHSAIHLGVVTSGAIGARRYWFAQLAVVAVSTPVYVRGLAASGLRRNLVAASCLIVLTLHLLMYPG